MLLHTPKDFETPCHEALGCVLSNEDARTAAIHNTTLRPTAPRGLSNSNIMAGDKEPLVNTVSARPGYRISRIEAPSSNPSDSRASAAVASGTAGTNRSLQREADDGKLRRGGGGGSSYGSAGERGRRRRNRRDGWRGQTAGPAASAGAAVGNAGEEDSGRLDRARSPVRLQHSPRVRQRAHRGRGERGQHDANNAARDGDHQRDASTSSSNPLHHRFGQGNTAPIDTTTPDVHASRTAEGALIITRKISSTPPKSPRNALFRGDDEREQRAASTIPSDDARGARRQVSRALRQAAIVPPKEQQHQGRHPSAGTAGADGTSNIPSSGAGETGACRGDDDDCHAAEGGRHRQQSSSSRTVWTPRVERSPVGTNVHVRGGGGGRDGVVSRDAGQQRQQSSPPHEQQRQHARGSCMSMCPAQERREREAEGGLSVFEATDATASMPFRERLADPNRTVKKYRRSAAGRNMHR